MNATGRAGRQAGFSLLEFGVVCAVFAILSCVLLQKLWSYQQEAHALAMRAVLRNLQTALKIKLAQSYIHGHEQNISTLVGQNPMEWLAIKPSNYIGEISISNKNNVSENVWYFNKINKTLDYVLQGQNLFYGNRSKIISFHVELLRLPSSPAKPSPVPEDSIGVVLKQVRE